MKLSKVIMWVRGNEAKYTKNMCRYGKVDNTMLIISFWKDLNI